LNALKEFQQSDLILGPSNDGGYWLIGLSEKIISQHLNLFFTNIKWGTKNVLQNTIDNFAYTKLKYNTSEMIELDPIIVLSKFYPWIVNYSFEKGLDPDNPRYLTKVTQTF